MGDVAAPGWPARLDAAAKRGFDLAVSAVALALLWPLLLGLALWVRLDSPGPAYYRALRVGRDGRPFTMLKFRTMAVGADRGAGITGADDARVTRAGRRLRRTRLDELPQLINVLAGDMSLVGPRPESPRYVRYYTPEQLAVLSVRPGVTGPTQLRFRDEAALLTEADVEAQYLRELLPAKLASDLDYVRRRTLLGDIAILVKTAGLALAGPRA
jgi:lipopolysaccharide/colanic/teichoic acid biosynthesis glycosyltransferase